MNPGRELDALIAEKVMGFRYATPVKFVHDGAEQTGVAMTPSATYILPHYSTDIATAWSVVEKVVGFSRLYDFYLYRYGDGEYTATFNTSKIYRGFSMESAAHAICLAALKEVSREAT
jgi:hypothetical protein